MDLDSRRRSPFNRNTHLARAHFAALPFLIALLWAASGANAATLNVSGGQLLGAFNVQVGGAFYNVDFVDGTCIDLFSGCDEASDFTFQTGAEATLASQALLDQVFLDGANLFDTEPELTNGCAFFGVCGATTVFAPFGGANIVSAQNYAGIGSSDIIGALSLSGSYDSATDTQNTFAVWSPVPEPGTAILTGLGLLGLAGQRRRELRFPSPPSLP